MLLMLMLLLVCARDACLFHGRIAGAGVYTHTHLHSLTHTHIHAQGYTLGAPTVFLAAVI